MYRRASEHEKFRIKNEKYCARDESPGTLALWFRQFCEFACPLSCCKTKKCV